MQLRSQLQATQQKLDPFILGISSAASVGAVLVILFGIFSFFGVYALSFGAFLGALLAFFVVFFLARRQGHLSSSNLAILFVFNKLFH